MTKTTTGVKRYNLVIPQELFQEVKEIADKEQTTVLEIFRRFIKLGIFVSSMQDRPDSSLILREGDSETRIVFL